MIVQPERYIDDYAKAGADIITVHYEACTHLHRVVQQIHANGKLAGVSLNPHSSVFLLNEIIPFVDMVLLMSVNPGFGGQKFIDNTYRKLDELYALKMRLNPNLLIQVDGGVNVLNAAKLKKHGTNVLVAGSAVFSESQKHQAIHDILYA
jgi:ribulose-phosphate 3-epimerase